MTDESDLTFSAYTINESPDMPIQTASVHRQWMDETDSRFAYRCLPLTIANQCGWTILCPTTFRVSWSGDPSNKGLRLEFEREETRILSQFGYGVLTFTIPYLFRTPEGVNLWVKGPTNLIKDGIQALEGVVETDWATSTFTMNWKLTRQDHIVEFCAGEPICMITPMLRGLAESLDPRQVPLSTNPNLERDYLNWSQSRDQFNHDLAAEDATARKQGWQKDYFHASSSSNSVADEHQTRLDLSEFSPDGQNG